MNRISRVAAVGGRLRRWIRPVAAEVLAAIGATSLAEAVLRRAISLAEVRGNSSELAAAYAARASVEERRGDVARAIVWLERAIDARPVEVWWYHCELAELSKARGAHTRAAAHLAEALRLLEPDVSPDFRARLEAELSACRNRASNDRV